jgi:phenylacetic acid degradation operon negative regulatory protein
VDIVSGMVHATPSFETFVLVIALATYRVLARSAFGCGQPAAGWLVAAGAVPVTVAPRLDAHASALELLLLLLLLEQPPAIRPTATTSAAPATAGRRAQALLISLLMFTTPRVHVLEQLSHQAGTARLARGRGGTTHTAGWPAWYREPVTAVAETNEPAGDAAARSARPRHLIVTVYGLYARSDGGWLSVAALIRLLAELGVDEPAVRSAISRLKRRGILEARRQEGSAGYQLSAEALAILREGDARIFRRLRAAPSDGWLLAVFSVPEAERQRRHVLRSELTRLGFGMVAPGVWIVPAHPDDATAETLRRLGLDAYADLFHADHLAFGDPADKIRRWWDLDDLERQYEAFVRVHEPALRRWENGTGDERQAFADYVRAVTDWRRLPYLDPGLPAELLPADWVGLRAAEDFFALRAVLEKPARAYVEQVISG